MTSRALPFAVSLRCAAVLALAALPWGAASPTAAADAVPRWSAPVPPPAIVVSGFAAPPEPWAAGHRGVDFAADAGAAVLAAGDGVVTFAGVVAGRGVISIDHSPPSGGSASSGPSLRTTYEPVIAAVEAGQPVVRGQQIGTLEPGGTHCPVGCLHWGVRDLAAEDAALVAGGLYAGAPIYRDPLTLLAPPRVRLLPRLPEPGTTQQTAALSSSALPRSALPPSALPPSALPRSAQSGSAQPSPAEPESRILTRLPDEVPPASVLAAAAVSVAVASASPLLARRRRRLTPH